MNNRVPKKVWLAGLALLAVASIPFATTQTAGTTPQWLAPAWLQALHIPLLPTILAGVTPATIPQTMVFADPTGKLTTYRSTGPVTTSQNAFFSSLGTNGRTCLSCHQPQNGWSITPASVLTTFALSQGRDPLFSPVDGADCPDRGAANTKFNSAFIAARSQLFTKGLFRIFIPEPTVGNTTNTGPEWYSVTVSSDPTGCENSATYGLKAKPPVLSFYRRPLSATNVAYVGPGAVGPGVNIMWDTREPSLQSQFMDATLVHAQGTAAEAAILQPAPGVFNAQVNQGVTFQQASFTGQSYDSTAGDLTGGDGSGALGGPVNLYNYSTTVFFAPFGGGCFTLETPGTLCPGAFGPNLASSTVPPPNLGTAMYPSFASAPGTTASAEMRQSIARGEALYNGTSPDGVFTIAGVTGLNELGLVGPANTPIPNGTCSTCHNNVNVGNDDFLDPKHLGIADNSYLDQNHLQAGANGSSTLLPTADAPLFTFLCPQGSILYFSNPVTVNGKVYDKYQTTDPGVGWITGKCADLGKFKVPVLRGLASRAPFFHNGQAASMKDVIVFYQNRFNMHLSPQEVQDLVNFMNSL